MERSKRMTGEEELKAYGGKPVYETDLGEVPEFLRGEQDYRYNPNQGRYMIFDKKRGDFLWNLSEAPEAEGEGRLNPYAVDNEPLPVSTAAPRRSMPVPTIDRGDPLPVPTIRSGYSRRGPSSEEMQDLGPAPIRATDEDWKQADMRGAIDIGPAPIRRTDSDARKSIEELRNANEFLKVLASQKKMKKGKK